MGRQESQAEKTKSSNLAVLFGGQAATPVELTRKPVAPHACLWGNSLPFPDRLYVVKRPVELSVWRGLVTRADASLCLFLNRCRCRQNAGAFLVGQELI
jgi:hypothetical protein